MILDNDNSVWLGTEDSHRSFLRMVRAQEDGSLLRLSLENPELQALSNRNNNEDYRIGEDFVQVQDGVAVISIKGGLVSSYAWYNSWFGVISYEEIRDAMQIAMEDDNVKKIMLDVDSPGGAVAYLDELADFIYSVDKNVKPVHGHVTSHAFSAGYWLICSCRIVQVSKMAQVGSIGVIMTTVSYAKMLEDAGVEYTYIRSGEFKALGQPGEKLSDTAKEEYKEIVMELHEFFEAQVIRGRGSLAVKNKVEWNSGKTFLPKRAMELGLVDGINTFDGHIAKLYENGNNGSQMSDSTNISLSKEAIMKTKLLTAEQQKKLASGVPLDKLGLSAEDLEKVKAELEGKVENPAASAEESGEKASDKENDLGAEENLEDGGDEDLSANSNLLKINADLNKQLARFELKLEQEVEAHEKTKTDSVATITHLEATQAKLKTVATEATNKLQVAVGAQETSLESLDAIAILKVYGEAKETFEATFNVGATSSIAIDEDRDAQTSQTPKNEIKKVNQE